jgi:hypothetical protein
MPKLQVTFFRHRGRPGILAVSPVSTNLVFLEPDDWELDRQEIIDPQRVSPGSEIAAWLESFRRLGYCVLEPTCLPTQICRGITSTYDHGVGEIRTSDAPLHSAQARSRFKRRRAKDSYCDFQMLPSDVADDVLFLGGKDYLPLFGRLTANFRRKPIVFFNSATAPTLNHCIPKRFETTTRTNWHYECADAIVRGDVRI